MEELKAGRTYNPCDECPYGIEKRDGSGDDSVCKICEFSKLLNRRAAMKNKPLTLEQLRRMDGEPIYVQTGEGKEGYVIIIWDCGSPLLYGPDWDESPTGDFDTDFYNLKFNDPAGHFGLHVLGWVAYLHKPEGPAS